MQLHAYLNFGGNCLEAFEYYEKHLSAKILSKMTFGEMPDNPHKDIEKGIMHARLAIADSYVMGSDVPPAMNYQPMRSAYLTLNVDSDAEAERIHAALAEGGEVFMPMQETFFAHRFSMLRDRFGVSWMIIHDKPMSFPQ